MGTEAPTPTLADPPIAKANDRRWVALIVVAVAQMMTALDATIVNIALPSVQPALGFSDSDRRWVITAYTLAFAGLLLVGGRVADRFGRRRAFLVGLAGFAAASAVAGAARNLTVLVAGRALQGTFAALLAPSALSLIAALFASPKERATAFAVYGGIASSGAAVGLLLGGALTEYLQWRWRLDVNVAIAGAALVAGWTVLPRQPKRPDVTIHIGSAILGTAGLAALVFGCARAAEVGWGAPAVLVPAAASAVAIVAFLLVQRRGATPLLPLWLLGRRDRAGAYVAIAVAVVGSFGLFLMLTYHFVLGYSPIRAGQMRQDVPQTPMIAPPAPYTMDGRRGQPRSTKVGLIQFSGVADSNPDTAPQADSTTTLPFESTHDGARVLPFTCRIFHQTPSSERAQKSRAIAPC